MGSAAGLRGETRRIAGHERRADAADDAACHPWRGEALAENLDRAVLDRAASEEAEDLRQRAAELTARNRALARPPQDRGEGLDHLRKPEEQNEGKHLRVLGAEEARHQRVIKRQAEKKKKQKGDRHRRKRIEGKERERPEGEKRAEHQKIPVCEIDDAHDA